MRTNTSFSTNHFSRPVATSYAVDPECVDALKAIAHQALNSTDTFLLPTAIALTAVEIVEHEDSWKVINPISHIKQTMYGKRFEGARIRISTPPDAVVKKVIVNNLPWLYIRDGNASGREGVLIRLTNGITSTEIRIGRVKEAAGDRYGKGSRSVSLGDSN